MCTGRIAAVRSVTAAVEACGSRFSVTGSLSAKTGRAPSKTHAFAEATNENGDVTTSSPSPTPMARSARCSAAVPDDTALAYGAPTRAANASSKAVTRGPSDSWPERRTSSTACSSASPRTGRASGIWSRTGFTRGPRGPAPGGRAGWARRSRGGHAPGGAALMVHAPGQEAGLQRVDQGLPAGLDHVLRDADRTPGVGPVGGVEQHPRHGARRLGLVEDADVVVDELDVGEVRIRLGDGR